MSHIALTGGTGYVGSIIADGLAPGIELTRLVRHPSRDGDIGWTLGGSNAGLANALAQRGVSDLVHAAWDMTTSSRHETERICVAGSLDLFRAAKMAGISRIIFISTISAFDDARSVYGQTKRQVEAAVAAEGGIVLRLGLVHGLGDGGMFGAIRRSVRKGRIVPMIGDGRGPQHLLDAGRLQTALRSVVSGDLDAAVGPITLAEEAPVSFRDLVLNIAAANARRPVLVPIPWRLLHLGLSGLEAIGVTPPVRSDSVISFVHPNPALDFTATRALGL